LAGPAHAAAQRGKAAAKSKPLARSASVAAASTEHSPSIGALRNTSTANRNARHGACLVGELSGSMRVPRPWTGNSARQFGPCACPQCGHSLCQGIATVGIVREGRERWQHGRIAPYAECMRGVGGEGARPSRQRFAKARSPRFGQAGARTSAHARNLAEPTARPRGLRVSRPMPWPRRQRCRRPAAREWTGRSSRRTARRGPSAGRRGRPARLAPR